MLIVDHFKYDTRFSTLLPQSSFEFYHVVKSVRTLTFLLYQSLVVENWSWQLTRPKPPTALGRISVRTIVPQLLKKRDCTVLCTVRLPYNPYLNRRKRNNSNKMDQPARVQSTERKNNHPSNTQKRSIVRSVVHFFFPTIILLLQLIPPLHERVRLPLQFLRF
jgi:hypothetical protein